MIAQNPRAWLQQPADVVQRRVATAPTRAFGSQNAFSLPRNSDWCVCMPLPFWPKIGFGMNDASKPELLRDVLHDEPERRDVVGRRQRVGVAEVDLVLAVRDLVVRRLHLEPHLLEHVDDRAPRVLAEVRGREIEVAADVVRRRRRLARPAPA